MERTKCEVYSRVVGYIRPVQQWHESKRHEFELRKVYKIYDNGTNETKDNIRDEVVHNDVSLGVCSLGAGCNI